MQEGKKRITQFNIKKKKQHMASGEETKMVTIVWAHFWIGLRLYF